MCVCIFILFSLEKEFFSEVQGHRNVFLHKKNLASYLDNHFYVKLMINKYFWFGQEMFHMEYILNFFYSQLPRP